MNQTHSRGCSLPLIIVQREKKSKIQNMQADTVDDKGADSSNSPFEVTSVEKTEKDKIDHTIHTGYFHTGEANTLIFIVEGGNAVSYFVMRSTIP